MLVGVISDTHVATAASAWSLAERLLAGPFADVDAIVHAGDLVVADLLSALAEKPVYAVRGNCDPIAVALPLRRVVRLAGWRIGLVHGWGAEPDIPRLKQEFAGEDIDVLVFGHSHQPSCLRHDRLLLFNPGSAMDRRQAPFHSVGLLELTDRVEGRIVDLDSWSLHQ